MARFGVEKIHTTKKAREYWLDGLPLARRAMLIPKERTEWVTVYINRQSQTQEWFPVGESDRNFAGIDVGYRYILGHRGISGDKGIASSAAKYRTLDPMRSHVLLLRCTDPTGFADLVRWYAGKMSIGPGQAPRPDEVSGEGRCAPLFRTAVDAPPMDTPSAKRQPQEDSPESEEVSPPTSEPQSVIMREADEVEDEEDSEGATGWMSDPEKRRAVEQYAVEMAKARYEGLLFDVEIRGKPYDLLCTPTSGSPPGTQPVHVEVKGSIGSGSRVELTRNEVLHARESNGWRTDLYILSYINLSRNKDGVFIAANGRARWIEGWTPHEGDLDASRFDYRVPTGSAEAAIFADTSVSSGRPLRD